MYDVMSKLQKSVFNTCYFTTSYMILNGAVLLTGSRPMRLRIAVRPILYIIAETSPIWPLSYNFESFFLINIVLNDVILWNDAN